MIAIIDYSTGNIRSVTNALERLGAEFVVTSNHDAIHDAERVILPGVGEARGAMEALRSRDLDTLIRSLRQPLLGICIGMQLLCRSSEEGCGVDQTVECLGIFDTDVKMLKCDSLKIPEMGWNSVFDLKSPLFDGVDDGDYVYYVHSYAAAINANQTIAVTKYGESFSAALNRDNFYGCQFHPEKSGKVGAKILDNFLRL